MSTLGTRSRRMVALAAAGVLLTIGLTACAGGTQKAPDEDTLSTEESYEDWAARYDSCLDAAGFDSSFRSGETVQTEADTEAYNKAIQDCVKKVGEPPAQENQMSDDEIFQAQLTFAKCLRDRGYDYPDPEKGGMSPAIDTSVISADDVDACSVEAYGEEGSK